MQDSMVEISTRNEQVVWHPFDRKCTVELVLEIASKESYIHGASEASATVIRLIHMVDFLRAPRRAVQKERDERTP